MKPEGIIMWHRIFERLVEEAIVFGIKYLYRFYKIAQEFISDLREIPELLARVVMRQLAAFAFGSIVLIGFAGLAVYLIRQSKD
jgi:hypothetical protein